MALPPQEETFPEEIVEEVLFRVAPEDPATLAVAAVANTKWCRLVTAASFRAKYLARHHLAPPPMLGLLMDVRMPGGFGLRFSGRFAPAPSSSFRPANDLGDLRPHDARHGRVLLRPTQDRWTSFGLVVWDPITGKRTKVPRPPRFAVTWKAAVFCAAAGAAGAGGDGAVACDHRGCHRGPFKVVYIADHRLGIVTCIYSSETRKWGEPLWMDGFGGFVGRERAAFVNNALHFMIDNQNSILKLDLTTMEMSVIQLPYLRYNRSNHRSLPIELLAMENNQRLGFAVMEDHRLCVWSMDESEEGWLLYNNIDLAKNLPIFRIPSQVAAPRMVGIAEGVGLAFMNFGNFVFSVDLKSGKVKKACSGPGVATAVIPYMNFCTPETKVPLKDGASRAREASGHRRQGKRPRVGALLINDGGPCAANCILNPVSKAVELEAEIDAVVEVVGTKETPGKQLLMKVPLTDGASRARGASGHLSKARPVVSSCSVGLVGKRPRVGALLINDGGPSAANCILNQVSETPESEVVELEAEVDAVVEVVGTKETQGKQLIMKVPLTDGASRARGASGHLSKARPVVSSCSVGLVGKEPAPSVAA